MTTYVLSDSELSNLNGKTVLITGGVTGFGREAVKIAAGQYSKQAQGLLSTSKCSEQLRCDRRTRCERRDRRLE